jgi:hypothetical protein
MRQTRRQFVGTALGAIAATGVALPAMAATGPIRVSLAGFEPRRLASLRRGVAAMKALPPSDHRSWFWQAATHAYNDALYADALKRDPKIAKVDAKRYWNQCPHFGQCSADFLIWHRAFLFYFERSLRDMAQDADLALPYWNYATAQGRGFPAAYTPQFLDGARSISNPLFHPTRNYDFTNGETLLSDPVALAPDTLSAPTFFSDIGVTGFGGDFRDAGHPRQSLIETRPHGDIHMVVGGYITGIDSNGAMSDIPTAAFDPVFWAHHANIDRLWTQWASSPGKDWGPLPPDAWLDEAPFLFVDFDGAEKSESRRFYMDRANLAVRYDSDNPARPELTLPRAVESSAQAAASGQSRHAAPPPKTVAPPPKTVAPPTDTLLIGAMIREIEIAADSVPINVSPNTPVSRQIAATPRPQAAPPAPPAGAEQRNANAAVAGTIFAPSTRSGRRVVLELSGISFDRAPSSGFAVYLATPDDPNGSMVGRLDLFGATHGHVAGMGAMAAVQSFDVTAIVRGFRGPFTIRVAPYDLLVRKSGAPAPRRADGVRIAGVRFLATG